VFANVHAFLQDSTRYGPNTSTFDPTRFLDSSGTALKPDVPAPLEAFGFGRRNCPGMYLAMEALWITVVSVLSAFDVLLWEEGKELGEDFGKFGSGLFSHPLPFKVRIVPRSKEVEGFVRSSVSGGG